MFSTVKNSLQKFNIKPSKKQGQNFLIDKNAINSLIKTADIKPDDIIIEVGPGLGALTLPMAKIAKQIIAVEKDSRMCHALSCILGENGVGNVKIINRDILNFQFSSTNLQSIFKSQFSNENKGKKEKIKYKIVANLPYNIATAVIMQFLEATEKPKLMAVMLQKEVAQKMLAKPPRANKLAVFSQFLAEIKMVKSISKNCFYPIPKVDTAILRLLPHHHGDRVGTGISLSPLFGKIVGAGFSHPRKQLANNLSKNLNLTRDQATQWLQKNKISPSQRAETLSLNNWLNLTKTY